jgi:hypothetical protein
MPTLDWIGKTAVRNHYRDVPYHLLKCDKGLSVGDPGTGNLLVQGDNLLALKALLLYYAGQVKYIYLDPPYNTGNENWVYNDNVNRRVDPVVPPNHIVAPMKRTGPTLTPTPVSIRPAASAGRRLPRA